MAKDDSNDPLDKLARAIKERVPVKKVSKANRTLALSEPNYTTLQNYCRSKGVPLSELVDSLISAFLEKIKDDLPPAIQDDDN
jgi:hypothetical protein